MSEFIFFIIFILGLALIPYRKIYNRLNQLIDAKTVLISLVLMVFPFVWMLFAPEMTEGFPVHQTDRAGMAMGSFAVILSWLIAAAGVVKIIFAIWTASEHQKEMKNPNQNHITEE